ncbi:MAG: DUF5777 family beta-barrel protein [Bacteroidia bacterium]
MKLLSHINLSGGAKITCLVFAACIVSALPVKAQSDSSSGSSGSRSEAVTSTFRGPQLINMPTNEIIDGMSFGIQHRFGEIVPGDLINDFFGMDLGAAMRISLGYPIIQDKLQVEIGRTNDAGINGFGKTVDLAIKYQIIKQTEKNEIPVTVTLFVDPSIATAKFPAVPPNAYYADSTTPFSYKFADRLMGYYQLIIGRKFTKNLSLEVSPAMIYQNLVPAGKDNMTTSLQFGGRYKFTKHDALIVEYAYIFDNRDAGTVCPFSAGIEFSTSGHIFQIVMSTTNSILGQDIYTLDNANLFKGNYYIGFNIMRIGF